MRHFEKKEKRLREFYRESFRFVGETKKYIFIISLIFIIFAILGYFASLPIEIESLLLQRLKEIMQMFEGLNLPQTIWRIFSNNVTVSFISIALGILFGIFPIITALSNGFIIGFVAHKAVSIDGILTLWRLFPHGIFEIPAVIISLGIGFRLGMTLMFRNKNIRREIIEAVKVFLFIVTPLLILAALIEGFLVFFVK